MKKIKFNFIPEKLITEKKEIKKKFPNKKEIKKNKKQKASNIDLSLLIEKINKTPKKKINYLADELNKYEIISLADNFINLPSEVINKVKKILTVKNTEFIFELLWKNYLEDYNNDDLIDLLYMILKNNKFQNKFLSFVKNIFKNKNPIENLLYYIQNHEFSFLETIEDIDIILENDLGQELAKRYFANCEKVDFKNEKNNNLLTIFNRLKQEDLYIIIENYILIFEEKELEKSIMYKIKERIGDPRDDYNNSWNMINNMAQEKAVSWFNYHKLAEFFDKINTNQEEAKKRFSYWEKHVNKMNEVRYIEKYLQLFLIFDNFVVIEFGNLGNAVYFYEKEFFNKNLAKFMNPNNAVNNNLLKETYKARNKQYKNVEKVNHHSSWQFKADRLIKKFSSGRR